MSNRMQGLERLSIGVTAFAVLLLVVNALFQEWPFVILMVVLIISQVFFLVVRRRQRGRVR